LLGLLRALTEAEPDASDRRAHKAYLCPMPNRATAPRIWPLLCAAALVELLGVTGVLPAHPYLVRAVALPPLDLTFDLGALLGRATSPGWFAAGLLVSVVVRTTVLALMLGSLRKWWFALRFELVVLVPSFVAAQLAYVGQAVLYSAAFWIGLLVSIASALAFAHVPWRGSTSVRSSLGRGFLEGPRLPTVISYLAAVGALGAITSKGGEAASLVGVLVSTLLTVLCVRRLSQPAAAPAATRTVGVVIVAAVAALALASTAHRPPAPGTMPGELLVVPGMDTSSGHGSVFSLRPSEYGFGCARTFYFSYAGPGGGAAQGQSVCPIRTGAPYSRADTERPLGDLVAAFRAQVDRLVAPVTVVTHSSGAWVALAAVSGDKSSPVRNIVTIAPITDPHGYPPPGASGEGIVGAAGMRLVVAIARSNGFSRFDPDLPLASRLLGSRVTSASLFDRSLPARTRDLAIPSAYDLALVGTSHPYGHALTACAPVVAHGALPTSDAVATEAGRFLAHRSQAPCEPWASWAASAAATFQVP